ncbi:MAG TPA: DNA repair protein RecN, partial [Parvularcula sp.]|nr:DNA repair protein RecN [Parvularcula sp.]
MLTALHIEDFLLIERLSLTLGDGLTALTGETGAGKSILLEALGLAAGGRPGRGGVRRGASRGVVAAAFEPNGDHPVWAMLRDNGLDAGDDQVILKRVQSADGKSRAFINDQPASVALLRAVGETL